MEWLAKEYAYPPYPTTHGLPDEDWDADPDNEPGHYVPFE